MKKKTLKGIRSLVVLFSFAAQATMALAQTQTLKVGDKAPEFEGKFIKGEPITSWEPGKLYVIECWATWCGPCKASIPHLNELHNKYKDKGLVLIGQDVWETEPEAVQPFVDSMGNKMAYRIAIDPPGPEGGRGGPMAKNWLAAAGKKAIPATFIVDGQGILVWMGHPNDLTEEMIEKGLAGTLTVDAANTATAAIEERKAKTRLLTRQITELLAAKNFTAAEKSIVELEGVLPDDQKFTAGGFRVDALIAQGDFESASKLALELSEKTTTNMMFRSTLVNRLVGEGVPPLALEAAKTIAARSNELLGGKDTGSMITLARIAMWSGNQAEAIAWQEKVVENSKPAARPRMQGFLDDYKAGRMPAMRKPATTGLPATQPSAAAKTDVPKPAEKSEADVAAPKAAGLPSLKVGDAAPKFAGSFIQGEPVNEFAEDKVYLVEFWATWCAPCKKAIPHLNELHNKFKDEGLVVIGQNIWERDDSLPAPFVKEMGEKMSYRIAVDDKTTSQKGVMAETWFAAAGQKGIPGSFLIKNGKIVWIGMPHLLTDELVESVIAGTFDVQASARTFEQKYTTEKAADETRARISPLLRTFSSQLSAKQWDEAQATFSQMSNIAKSLPAADRRRIAFQELRLDVAKGDPDKSLDVARRLLDDGRDELAKSNVARLLLSNPNLGADAARFADEQLATLSDTRNASTLALKARASFIRGNSKNAIALQEQAVALSTEKTRQQNESALESYRNGVLPR